jgi:ribonuclease J
MKINIRRGANQIGGSAVELIADNGERIILDLGLPLDAEENTANLLPDINGLTKHTPDLLGLFISHAHQDHFALGKHIDQDIPVYMSEESASQIKTLHEYISKAKEAVDFPLPDTFVFQNTNIIKERKPLTMGAFTITPYLVDHAAPGSFAFLIEADNKRVFYSGDFRAHGREIETTENIIKNPPENIDVLLMEGSSLERLNPDQKFETEEDLERQFSETFKNTRGLALLYPSSSNAARIISIYRAAQSVGRILVLSSYTGLQLMMLKDNRLPSFINSDVKKLVVKSSGKRHEITAEQMLIAPDKYVYVVGRGNLSLLKSMLTTDATYIYSMWSGYNEPGEFAYPILEQMQTCGVKITNIHTSGHADIPTLRRFLESITPKILVPIHTFHPEQFAGLFGEFAPVELHRDNEYFEV